MTACYPSFFDDAPSLAVWDPLSAFLGATTDGMIEYRYIDAVQLTGHSCPTVAGAYLMTLRALRHLYPDRPPERGNIEVYLPAAASVGVTGVVAKVASLITGAALDDGFKGIGGRFDRRGLLFFGASLRGGAAFRRRDTGAGAGVTFDPSLAPPSPLMSGLMAQAIAGSADTAALAEFRALWQDRVRRILVDHADDDRLVRVSDWVARPDLTRITGDPRPTAHIDPRSENDGGE